MDLKVSFPGENPRSRVLSADPPLPAASSRPSRRKQVHSLSAAQPTARPMGRRDEDTTLSSSFSDEYDLAHEDPQILQDVQRALRGKARRDSRLKSGLPPPKPEGSSDSPSPSSSATHNHIAFPPSISAPFPRLTGTHVDFRPSTKPPSLPSHPIPRSSDDGSTLDWSLHDDADKHERKWSLSIAKGKDRNGARPSSLSAQEHMYSRHLDTTRSRANPQSLYKAEVVARQLGRRYQFLSSSDPEHNLLRVTRWYGEQDKHLRDEFEDAEPFLWLLHLDHKKRRHDLRSPLNLSALVIERYIQSTLGTELIPPAMASIPEDRNMSNASFPLSTISNPGPQSFYPFASIQSKHPQPSANPRYYGSASQEDVSFRPVIPSGRNSFESRRSVDSFPGSLQEAPLNRSSVSSPASSRLHLRDLVFSSIRDKEDSAHPSPRASLSEDGTSARHPRSKPRPPDMDREDADSGFRVVISRPLSETVQDIPKLNLDTPKLELDTPKLELDTPKLRMDTAQPEPPPSTVQQLSPIPRSLSHARILGRRKRRTSLPSSSRRAAPIDNWERQRQENADEEKLRQDYERKARLVSTLAGENTRIRMVLHHIATIMRDYDASYSKVMTRLGLPHARFPPETLEAFVHDPSTYITDSFRGHSYHIVENIHAHVMRQRAALAEFVETASLQGFEIQKGVLEEPMQALLQILGELEEKRVDLSAKSGDISKLLEEVQGMEMQAREAYDQTSTLTSGVYPQLSTIANLEESYKDQYQHIWDICLNAVTLLFDTIAPFWRTYGRTILNDVIAFLVIPLYRHEFTGEPKRYPIIAFPRRSFRHWVGLVLFLGFSTGLLLIQGRTTLSSLRYYSLSGLDHLGIRYALVPFFWIFILVQTVAVLLEAAIVAIQMCIWAWWFLWVFRIVS